MKSQQIPTNWNNFEDIEELSPFSEADRVCLDEVSNVLQSHSKQHLFGVSLLHKHFDLGEDEVMLETQDPTARTITSRPVKLSELAGIDYRVTAWRLDGGKLIPIGACASGAYGDHYGYKD